MAQEAKSGWMKNGSNMFKWLEKQTNKEYYSAAHKII